MKRLSVFLVLLILFFSKTYQSYAQITWDGSTIATGYAEGTGTNSNPYKISTAPQFVYFLKSIQAGETYSGKYFVLTNEISIGNAYLDTTSTSCFFGGTFDGTLNGGNHFVKGLTRITYLFSTLNGVVSNLGIENDNVSEGRSGNPQIRNRLH